MKRKILLICLAASILLGTSGCNNYGSIKNELEQVTVQNVLPDVTKAKYTTLAAADDAIYEQQLAACKMLSESYSETYYKNFIEEGKRVNENKISQLCNDKRNNIDSEIGTNFILNIYHLISSVKDCPNQDAFLEKTYSDVLNFYDAYNNYIVGRDKDEAICDILINYSERNNLLALNFLAKNEQKVYSSATAVIEKNSKAEENDDRTYRYYINKNNRIINALNSVYGGVPQVYAKRISNAGTRLGEKLMNSLDSISDAEKERLLAQMTSSASPSPAASEHPQITLPTAVPSIMPLPSAAPALTMPPRVTAAPQVTQRPVVQMTQAPVVQVTQAPAAVVTQRPVVTPEPEPIVTPQPEPEYNFSVDDEPDEYYFN